MADGEQVPSSPSTATSPSRAKAWKTPVTLDPVAKDVDAAPLPLLMRAAAEVARASRTGRPQTVACVLHGRALRHYARGLREYLALRLCSSTEADAAWRQLRAMLAVRGSDALVKPPGIRAQLYRIAREVVASRSIGFDAPAYHHTDFRFDRLRRDLDDDDAELLELRFARELQLRELCTVLDRPVEEVAERLSAASEMACALLSTTRGEGLRGLLIEAFRVRLPAEKEAPREELPPPLATGTVVGRRYRLQSRVGEGAFGDVYRAEDTEVPGHVVALKLLHQPSYTEQARDHARRELRHIASVHHPSVVQLKDHGWHEQRLWFVMPWYDGETLASRIERTPLSREEALRIFVPLARALEAMHAAGIRHQDVKPDNIFLAELPGSGDVLPVLIDLGVATTEAEMLVAGTPTYFAPEVAAQFADVADKPWVDTKADVFSLALTLRNALEPETEDEIAAGAVERFIERRCTEAPPGLETRSLRYLQPSFDRWLSLSPEERPSALALAEELPVLVAPEEKRARRRRLLRAMLPVWLLAAGGLGGAVVHYEAAQAESGRALDTARSEIADARSEIAMTAAARDVLADRYARMQLSEEQLRHRLVEATVRQQQLDGALQETETALAGATSEAAATQEILRTTLLEKEQLQSEMAQQVEAAEDAAQTAAQTIAATNDALAAQVATRTTLEQSLETARADIAELDRLGEVLTARLEDARAELARAEAAHAASTAAVEAERARRRSLEEALASERTRRQQAEAEQRERSARSTTPDVENAESDGYEGGVAENATSEDAPVDNPPTD